MKLAPESKIFTPQFILKVWAEGFNIPNLGEMTYELEDVHLAYNRYRFVTSEIVTNHLKSMVTSEYLDALSTAIQGSMSGVKDMLRDATFEGLTAEESTDIIRRDSYGAEMGLALTFISAKVVCMASPLQLMASDERKHAIGTAIKSLKKRPAWNTFYASLSKDGKDKLGRWINSDELPSLKKISSLFSSESLDENTRKEFATQLIHARFVDSLKKNEQSKKLFGAIRTHLLTQDFSDYTALRRVQICQKHEAYFRKSQQLIKSLKATTQSTIDETYLKKLEEARAHFAKEARGWVYELHCCWLLAHYALHQGKLDEACTRYKEVIEHSTALPPAGQYNLLSEALMCASMHGTKGHAILLRQAKNLGIVFDIIVAHDHPDEWSSKAYSQATQFIKPYEVERLQQNLKTAMPRAKLDFEKVPDPFIFAYMDAEKLTSPNTKSKIGDTTVSILQFSQAVMLRDYEKVESMLPEVSILKRSDHSKGHSALIIALQNYRDSLSSSDKSVVLLLMEKLKTENRVPRQKFLSTIRTDKKKLTPLSLSIESYDAHIVRSLLSLGACPNFRCTPQFNTPLLHAMKRLAECLDNPTKANYVESSRQIVHELLKRRADPTCTHDFPGRGYTVGMLAAELDEVEILKAFHRRGMSLTDEYLDPVEKKYVGLGHIAMHFGSVKTLAYLKGQLKAV